MTFQNMRLHESIVNAIVARGYEEPTPIQSEAIPAAMDGRDILGCAQTGTGKTCAFAVPILHRLAWDEAAAEGRRRPPRALVLCPTRELAMQIGDSFAAYGSALKLRHTVVYGGVKQARQVRALREGVDILIATPGRLLDLVNQGHIRLDQVETFVLDEADRMLDMGFIEDIRRVVDLIPKKHQTLFFSATVSKDIHRLADSLLIDPIRIETAPESTTVELIEQRLFLVKHADKPELLKSVLDQDAVDRVLVFTKTRRGADRLVRFLKKSSIRSEAIHADKTQHQRTKAMAAFKKGNCLVLIATDIAARGIDVEDITHVVNYDMPIDPETYVHRIGRTARAGARGIAISFCDRDETKLLKAIERRSRIRLDVVQDVDALCTREFSGIRTVVEAPAGRRTDRRETGSRTRGTKHDRPRHSGRTKTTKTPPWKSFDETASGTKPSGKKPFGKKPSGKKPFGKKPFGKKPIGKKPFGWKPQGDQDRFDHSAASEDRRHSDRKRSDRTWSKPKRSWNPDERTDRSERRTSKPTRTGRGAPPIRGGAEDRNEHPWSGGHQRTNQRSGKARPKGSWKPNPGKKKYQSRGWSKGDARPASEAGSGSDHRDSRGRSSAPRRSGKPKHGEPRGSWKKTGNNRSSKPRTWAPRSNGGGTSKTTGSGARSKAGGFSDRRGKGTRPGGKHAGASTKGQRPGSGAGRRPKGGWSARPGSSSHRKRTAKR
ncbi:MAG: DEAD/DEAH box helicase [Planctomycetota bacterium]|nr:DEAD/DEAH box helicase [Planctomycetota bacterium]